MRIIVNRRKKGVNFNLNQVTDLAYQIALQIFFAPGKMKVKEGTKSVEEGKIIFFNSSADLWYLKSDEKL